MPQLEEILVKVWRQTLVDGAKSVEIDGKKYPVKTTAKRRLKQVDSRFGRSRIAWFGAESRYQIEMGCDGP